MKRREKMYQTIICSLIGDKISYCAVYPHGSFVSSKPFTPPEISTLQNCDFETDPLPLGISINLSWDGYFWNCVLYLLLLLYLKIIMFLCSPIPLRSPCHSTPTTFPFMNIYVVVKNSIHVKIEFLCLLTLLIH